MDTEPTAYESTWFDMLAALRDCTEVELSIEQEPDSDQDVERIYRDLADRDGIVFEPALIDRQLRFSRLTAEWQVPNPEVAFDPLLTGEFSLSTLDQAIDAGGLLAVLDVPRGEHRRYSQFRCFDDTPWSGVGYMAMVRIEPGVTDPEVWFKASTMGCYRLDIGYAEYLDTLRITKGATGWQLLFTDISMSEGGAFAGTGRRMEDMLEVLPTLFPDHDYQPLRERLAERRRDYRLRCPV
ncbi:hypothetical protein [Actinoalloteichus hymeniacidonis]|uniref:Uncharacterized protein n=1 Tax=Actinoalloteichus hymeniacidonis TaxID=340345 RepID=A0AAC9HRJ9_9PSEU|nr:hypothetical protein [Actinoalloteichus hymeniacidonis]AOS64309.1 hypothetical protein TL08_17545 [Actinoalloteichus hymeniacidonis]MBB5907623.1 hypothetical protein [Actinoalloteichus hymeniacidonis]